MGGKALKKATTRRYERDEYFDIWRRFSTAFSARFPYVRFALIPSCGDKTSFGDMDVVIAGDAMPDNWHEAVDELFDVRESSFKMNKVSSALANDAGYTAKALLDRPYSFHIDELQIDLCPFETRHFDFALAYLSYGDLGNFMGTVYRSIGVRFGMKGLRVEPLDAAGNPLPNHQVLLTQDHAEALRFAGYDPLRFAAGFASEAEVYRYVASSPYFRPALFLEERPDNAKKRERLRSRPALGRFIAWCEEHREALPNGIRLSRTEARRRIYAHFPRAEADCAEVLCRVKRAVDSKRRFSGKLITEVTGVAGPELGKVAEYLRSHFENTATFHDWMGRQSDDELRAWVKGRYEIFRSRSESCTS